MVTIIPAWNMHVSYKMQIRQTVSRMLGVWKTILEKKIKEIKSIIDYFKTIYE